MCDGYCLQGMRSFFDKRLDSAAAMLEMAKQAAVLIPPAGARLGAANNGRGNENNVGYVDCSILLQWFVSQERFRMFLFQVGMLC